MPRTWPIYTYIAIAALLGVAIPLGVERFTRMLRGNGTPSKPLPGPRGASALGSRINLRFFSGASVATLGFVGIFLLIPVLLSLRSGDFPREGMLLSALLLVFLAIGFFYAARKGDLSWLRNPVTERNEDPR